MVTMDKMSKTLDQKLARIAKEPGAKEFILADAKDADMAFGVFPTTSFSRSKHPVHSIQRYRDAIREVIEQGLVDIMLMSVSTNETLAIDEKLFNKSTVTPAIRANDTTDIWLAGTDGSYASEPSLPFRSALIDHAMYGRIQSDVNERACGADLGLYSITLNHRTDFDVATLEAYRQFRKEAENKGFRHFLEVFPPNACETLDSQNIAKFLNNSIARILAGIARRGRPIFLKIPYFGPHAMEELCSWDSSLVVGILGGAAGTTFDAFHQLAEARKYGARAALYGRMINQSEHQPSFIRQLRALADDQTDPATAVKEYHSDLGKLNVRPVRSLEDDLIATLKQDSSEKNYNASQASKRV